MKNLAACYIAPSKRREILPFPWEMLLGGGGEFSRRMNFLGHCMEIFEAGYLASMIFFSFNFPLQ